MDNVTTAKKKKLQAGLALLILSAVIVGTAVATPSKAMVAMENTATTSAAKQAPTAAPSPDATASSTPTGSLYKDGSYSATGSYFSPAGQESITVDVSLKNDVVITSNAQSGANDPTAMTYQTSFISGYKQFVVGKKINSIKLSNVSGSSLTSQGFNDAIKQIEQQAKA